MKHTPDKLARTVLCGATLLSVAVLADFGMKAAPAKTGHLNVICSTSLFHGVDRAELMAISKIWLQNVAKGVGWTVNPQIELTDTVEAIKKRVDEGTVDIVVASTLEYLALARPGSLTPMVALAAEEGNKGKVKYLLLVSRDSGFSRVEDLKGKSLAAYSRFDSSLSRMWVETLLKERHLGSSEQFFRSYASASKPSAACLPLFFGKADACLIDDPSWNVLRELNPQLGGKLKVLAESPEFVETLLAMHVNAQEHQAEIVRGMLGLRDNPEGKQILLFFKSHHPVAINKQDLDSVVDLRSKYLKSEASAGKVR